MIVERTAATIELLKTQLRNITFSLKLSPSFTVALRVRRKVTVEFTRLTENKFVA